jgi:DNA-binding transcriptional MerR regulator
MILPPYQTSAWLRPREVAELLKVSVRTLVRWRHIGIGPKFIRLGGTVRYSVSSVLELAVPDVSSRQKDFASDYDSIP